MVKAADFGLLALRAATGAALVAHGYPKLFGGEGRTPPRALTRVFGKNFPEAVASTGRATFAQGLKTMGVPYPDASATASALAEFGGGLALLLGLLTRPAAIVVAINMGVAIRKAHWETGFYGRGGFELASQLLAAATALLLAGPGAISLDRLRSRPDRADDSAGS